MKPEIIYGLILKAKIFRHKRERKKQTQKPAEEPANLRRSQRGHKVVTEVITAA
eukprot:gene732-1406_t